MNASSRSRDVAIWLKGDNDFGAVDEATTVRLVQMRFAMKQGRIRVAGSRTRARRREPRISHPCGESRPCGSPRACLRLRCDGAQAARRSPPEATVSPSGEQLGLRRFRRSAGSTLALWARRPGAAPEADAEARPLPGESRARPSALGALATFDSRGCAPGREPTRLAQRPALAALALARAHRLPPPH
jgi:hypothetical protein